ncbi:uncharacterized protein LOC116351163 isoform X3 [Contarinia nasturtii]|uniref:uncharacterized protein LOC116351163 isoform X3 n=1 Tax=Contarinia nasturtii TaxID=265458 RepID=UPI0012D44DA0|nr:uncharacterized protein LOC116351163 isoform X3 [Contarinia nasturtii]XP_031639103.1 uncharacterized protein LOC116351163 isoform X3 [Contarinia nasturtii]XP_031639104.1 uncharacterized protein LOC116351163 isoform X3 [Contarinia nasturtii]
MATEDGSKGRTLAIAIGWLILIISVALFYMAAVFILPALIYGQTMIHVYIVFAFYLLINVSWIFGAMFYKPVFMLIALAGWLFPAASCLYCVFIGIVRGIQHLKVENLEEDKFPLFKIVCFALVFIGIYIIAVFCYCSVKRAAIRRKPNTMRLNIKYEVPQGNVEQNEGIRLYPTLNTDQI